MLTKNHRFVVLGTGGLFTCYVIRTLTEYGCIPLAYIQAGSQATTPREGFDTIEVEVEPEPTLNGLLLKYDIPYYVQTTGDLANRIQTYNPDFILVACWPGLLPGKILSSASLAALNLHPSLLPAFRGPDPVQAQLDANDHDFGITLHVMNEELDAGDIVLQEQLTVQNNMNKDAIEKLAAEHGALLFIHGMETYDNPGWKLVRQNRI